MKNGFRHFSSKVSNWAGSTMAFLLAALVVIVWLLAGPHSHYSETWLIVIATISDVIIFLMVFLIQNTQNRDSKAIQLKLNELISVDEKARATFIGLENMTDNELAELDEEFKKLIATLEVTPAMHKLHKHIKHEKEHRSSLTGFTDQAGHIIDTILSPLSGNHDDKE
jgi:low affinity Fe/Cu permease